MKLVKVVAALLLLSINIHAEEAPKAEAPKAVEAPKGDVAAPAHPTVAKGKANKKPAAPKAEQKK